MSKFNRHLKKLADLLSRHQFIVERTMETPQGTRSMFEYGHLGAELRRNLRKIWWHDVVTSKETVNGVELSMFDANECLSMDSNGRVACEVENLTQKLLSLFHDKHKSQNEESLKHALTDVITTNSIPIRTPNEMNGNILLGSTEGTQPAMPVGYAWHARGVSMATEDNEMSRNVENDLLCLRFFCDARTFKYWLNYWRRQRIVWWRKLANNPSTYSSYDIPQKNGDGNITENQYNFPWGKEGIECFRCGSNAVGTDIRKDMSNNLQHWSIQMTTNLDKGFIALLSDAYEEKDLASVSGEVSKRSTLHLHPSLSPYKVAIHCNHTDANELIEVSHQLASELRQSGIATSNEQIGDTEDHVFVHHDEIGTPYCVSVLPSTLSNGVVALRNRDTTLQEFLHISDVLKTLQSHLNYF